MSAKIIVGDCVAVMAGMEPESVDAVITDPPYDLTQRSQTTYKSAFPGRYQSESKGVKGFMALSWDGTGVAFNPETWRAAMRVLKPGGHLLSFGSTRTYHRLVCAIEDAEFEIRDTISWIYGSGFPKSHNISKAIDKAAGAERDVIGSWKPTETARIKGNGNSGHDYAHEELRETLPITAPATDAAKQWDGWGTALKPAQELICLARKPLAEKTIAANVLAWGTGALNIDGCRVGANGGTTKGNPPKGVSNGIYGDGINGACDIIDIDKGRWPANLILNEAAAADIDAMSGTSTSTGGQKSLGAFRNGDIYGKGRDEREKGDPGYGDRGGASRFFYCAKSSRSERNAGLEGMPERVSNKLDQRRAEYREDRVTEPIPMANHHPTVKPISLMRYLCRLITPPGGVLLDPFAGSGSTGCAAVLEGFDFIGIEQSAEYVAIAEKRIDHWAKAA